MSRSAKAKTALGALTAAVLICCPTAVCCPVAAAIPQPVVDPAAVPADGRPGPVEPMSQRYRCAVGELAPGSTPAQTSQNLTALNITDAQRLSRGDGVLVAVVDTGVQPGPRLPGLAGGGDYVEDSASASPPAGGRGQTTPAGGNGLTDCDDHGTIVAGIVAGQPADDGFSGVAPGAKVLAVRAASNMFSPKNPTVGAENPGGPAQDEVEVFVRSLAAAIVHAANRGARVILISTVNCLPVGHLVDQGALGAALRYAAVDKDALIVAAAGNTEAGCQSNPLIDPAKPADPRNWSGVSSVSIPSWWQPYVLSVGSTTVEGQPSATTMAGPWVGIAAPGEHVTSIGANPGHTLVNAFRDSKGNLAPVGGTGAAAAVVAGVGALVRAKYPDLTAHQVMNRITATAHNAARAPSNLVGAGVVDPVAALTWEVPSGDLQARVAPVKRVAPAPAPAPVDNTPRNVALIGTGVLAAAALLAASLIARKRAGQSPNGQGGGQA